ncbi:histidinol dehydrogenase, partial [Streptococcus pneumoniae]|nr:histidinol dehydrogenase [Streptococcus pneumoniae]
MNITYIQEGETETLSLKRTLDTGTEEQRLAVQWIIQEVRKNGDQAVQSFTKQFDGVQLEDSLVTEEDMTKAFERLDPAMIQV